MRLYSFVCGSYLSQLQRGIQTAHALGEMVIPFLVGSPRAGTRPRRKLLVDWLKNHKTIIVLNAGNQEGVQIVYNNLMYYGANTYPIAYFNEDKASLNEAWTAAAIIVPARYYEKIEVVKNYRGEVQHYTNGINVFVEGTKEFGIIDIIRSHRLVQS